MFNIRSRFIIKVLKCELEEAAGARAQDDINSVFMLVN